MPGAHAVTQIVLGASRRSRWEEMSRGSLARKLLRAAAEAGIDVHVIAREAEERTKNGRAKTGRAKNGEAGGDSPNARDAWQAGDG